ncbi:MAG: 6-carboxy-5,6,7,8-tetrahydropterin synthase [Bacteriovoracaceae bacterium]|nr:6-carboxy-5,6,7,8-tetrahydropterin synthase [Bacteriovoracaceae bacterium]
MTWRLEKEFRFEASHQLPNHQGKCSRLHGHSWTGRLVCEANRLQESGSSSGMVVDFDLMTKIIQPLLEKYLDHWHLNESLKMESPTSEMISRWIFEKVKPDLPELTAVIVDETCKSRCEYRP